MTKFSVSTVSLLVTLVTVLCGPGMARAQELSAEIPLTAAQYKLSRLVAGQQSGQVIFPVDEAETVTVQILSNDGGLTTSILGPAGQTLDPNTVASFGGTYTAVESAGPADSPLLLPVPAAGFQFLYTFPSLGSGDYTVRFSTASTAETAVIVDLTTDSHVGVALLATDPRLVLGGAAVLTAPVFEGATPVPGAVVTVSLLRGAGPAVNLTLLDDGGPGDDAADDGLYSGEITPTQVGQYQASAIVTGTTSGGDNFIRHAATTFEVVPATAALDGSFSDNGVDDDFDGLFDRVSVFVTALTTTPGRYRAFVHLRTANGQTLVRSGEADLPGSGAGIVVDFDGSAIVALQEDGPYHVELLELLFLDAAGAVLADSFADAGDTRAYLRTEFERALLATTGLTSDTGIDDNGNGQFDRLIVSVQVEVLQAGFYSWGFKLTDQAATEIEFGTGSGFLNAGFNDLAVTFDGRLIGAFGVDGPYQLRDLLIQGGGASLVQTELGQTQSYGFGQFEGAVSNVAPIANAGADQTVQLSGSATASVTLDGTGSTDDGAVQPLSYSWVSGTFAATGPTPTLLLPLGTHLVTLTVDDGQFSATDDVLIVVEDPTAPIVTASVAGTLGTNGWYTSDVTVSFTTVDPESGVASSTGCASSTVTSDTAGQTFTCTATNGAGASTTATETVKRDATAPIIFLTIPSKKVLWPPNHQMVRVDLFTIAADPGALLPSTSCQVASVASNEPVSGHGAGWTSPDWVIVDRNTVMLRAERLDDDDDHRRGRKPRIGRIYTITVECADRAGNADTSTTTVHVPHSQGHDGDRHGRDRDDHDRDRDRDDDRVKSSKKD